MHTDADLGPRLRAIRRKAGLSLQDVEAQSNREFKASALGAYERGDRVISVPRLVRLAHLYRITADQLLAEQESDQDLDPMVRTQAPGVTIDLVRLHEIDDPNAVVVARYAATIQSLRRDFDHRVLTIRGVDLNMLAALMGKSPETLSAWLEDLAPARPA
jgi:transcriptional regulator with XRE-family HTH domain